MSDERARADGARTADRLTALSDGIFAIAMTLLVLDIRVPRGLDDARFRDAVQDALPDIGAYALSFVILAGFWRDHRRILALVPRFEGPPLRFALAWLGAVAFLPFPTSLLSEYASEPLAVAVYAGTVAVTNLLGLAVLRTGRPGRWTPGAGRAEGGAAAASARSVSVDLGARALVFALSVPLAFAWHPFAAIWFWLADIPLRGLVRRFHPA
ncbi:TMEM175 family protein [Streptomyces sp. NBC_00102]|uniref:TMEM175 family protein n=1 Tax=Streptomyces sp. NBC_00102 TaxID=2975652 RepID=UPI0022549F46|nr:TMEM175 family protein [Streptomyces sp. NBC_00102]MCX5396375.1 TMEM175 family protein [Streptomyces sp. NBC_00102]